MSPSRPNAPQPFGGFAPWPHRTAYQPEATALIFFALFVAFIVSGVSVMSLYRGSYSVEQMDRQRELREQGGRALQVVGRDGPVEKVEGAFSFPEEIKRQVRFRKDHDGKLILRINSDGQWRDARITDLAPVEVDLMARRDRSRSQANSFGSGMSASAIQRQHDRQGAPAFVRAEQEPRDKSPTVVMRANFYVTSEAVSTDSPLFDHHDPIGSIAARMARVRELMRMTEAT